MDNIEPFAMQSDNRPLVLHVMYRFDVGGLENGIVNLINNMPIQAYRHAVLALTEVTDFRLRVQRHDVGYFSLKKPPGHGVWLYPTLFRLFRKLRPAIVHSRNLAALEVQAPAWAAGVPIRIHGEHGFEAGDLGGRNLHHLLTRRFYKPFIHHYTALSRDLGEYLSESLGVAKGSITQACNGVDTEIFRPSLSGPQPISGCPFDPSLHWLVGCVGRMQAVKDPVMLAHAFVLAIRLAPALRSRLRLIMVGDGPLRSQVVSVLNDAGMIDLSWLPGARNDVPDILRGLHALALPSLSEGISNAILEAMASGLPVVATAVGGNTDLVLQGQTGCLVKAVHPQEMADCLIDFANSPAWAQRLGQAGRTRVLTYFSMSAMVSAYLSLYEQQLDRVALKNGRQ